jgi:hypothetical protein
MGTPEYFREVKQSERDADHSVPSVAGAKNIVATHLLCRLCLHCTHKENFSLPLPLPLIRYVIIFLISHHFPFT